MGSLSRGQPVPDDSLHTMSYYHFSGILRAVQLDFFLDVLSGRVGNGKVIH